ncbi:hypothetical protein PCANC_08582 [Puccinia coronata f. sp. avenae]|uniref:Uncharacterized protein n=1 Tax=Puccinia coronata f. sp. avenae TaxID=200324 RepID=A0A2N5V1W4_9BASI|nr:hypothetical protein PCANC_08582 [Puccinia coronata f. sp. avenae]
MTGKVKMPKSEHIHAAKFPTNEQIDNLLEIAQKRANVLIHFTGMQKVTGEKSDPALAEATSPQDDVSVSINQAYYYKSNPALINDQSDDIHVAIQDAALVASKRHILDHDLLSNKETHEQLDTQITQNSRMSIHNLLSSPAASSDTPMPTNKKRDPNLKDQTSLKLVVNNKLHIDNLLCLRHNHDSEKQLHQGNGRKKRLNDHPSNSTESSKALDPKTCSKIVAICLKEEC